MFARTAHTSTAATARSGAAEEFVVRTRDRLLRLAGLTEIVRLRDLILLVAIAIIITLLLGV